MGTQANPKEDASIEESSSPPELKLATRKPRFRPPAENHDDSDGTWLISYADMMTLLVGFFAMLLAFSKIDQSAFEQMKKETTKVFGGEYQIPFEKLSKELKDVVKQQGLEDQVLFHETDEGITITFRGALFFRSGESDLLPKAEDLIKQLIPVIKSKAKNFGIVVEGHTDNIPMESARFPSNWDLSSIRACTVLRLFESYGFPKTKLQALGWGETRPIVPNEDSSGRAIASNQAQNRRVVLKILKDNE